MSVTQREMVVQTSFYSFLFLLIWCKCEWVFLFASALVLCLLAGWLAAVWFSSTLIFIKRDKKKNYMQSGTIESMRELNHPRNTKYLWQRVQWIAKVAQMNVLKRIFFSISAFSFFSLSFASVWFSSILLACGTVSRVRTLSLSSSYSAHLTTSCCLLLHFQSFSLLLFILCLVLSVNFRKKLLKIFIGHYRILFFFKCNIFSALHSVGTFFSFSLCFSVFFSLFRTVLTLKKWCWWWTPKSNKNKLCRTPIFLIPVAPPALNVTHSRTLSTSRAGSRTVL